MWAATIAIPRVVGRTGLVSIHVALTGNDGHGLVLHRSVLPALFNLSESLPTGHGSGGWGRTICYMEEYIGVEPTLSAWRAEVLTVIRILHKIAGEPYLSPAIMFVL